MNEKTLVILTLTNLASNTNTHPNSSKRSSNKPLYYPCPTHTNMPTTPTTNTTTKYKQPWRPSFPHPRHINLCHNLHQNYHMKRHMGATSHQITLLMPMGQPTWHHTPMARGSKSLQPWQHHTRTQPRSPNLVPHGYPNTNKTPNIQRLYNCVRSKDTR